MRHFHCSHLSLQISSISKTKLSFKTSPAMSPASIFCFTLVNNLIIAFQLKIIFHRTYFFIFVNYTVNGNCSCYAHHHHITHFGDHLAAMTKEAADTCGRGSIKTLSQQLHLRMESDNSFYLTLYIRGFTKWSKLYCELTHLWPTRYIFSMCGINFEKRRDHRKNFLWARRLWVGRR